MKRIYLDYAATSPIKKTVLQAMQPYLLDKFGNPSSLHSFGQEARAGVDWAREQVAKFLNCKPTEIIFTSGGTESDNLAIRGVIEEQRAKSKEQKLPHIITSAIEHHAVLHTCQDLEKKGLAEVTYLPVDKFGRVSVSDVRKAIKENTVLVSIMYANNEIGTIEPIRDIGKMIEKTNKFRISDFGFRILFHTDAVQAVGYLNCDVKYLHVDMLSLSAHKFGGPKGVGALYVREGVNLAPEITGGGQEYKKRAGTENVPAIVGLGEAVTTINNQQPTINKIQKLRDELIDGILREIPDVILTGHPKERLPNIASFCFKYIEGESIMLNLDLKGVAVSTGSACTSGSLQPSHVLMACGFNHETTQGSIRFSLGEDTTEEEIDYVLKILPPIVKRLRKMSPFGKEKLKIKNQK